MKRPKINRSKLLPTQKNLVSLYYISFMLCTFLFLLAAILSGGKTLQYAFYYYKSDVPMCTTDGFMDFFNSVRDASHNGGYEKGVIYPPLANLIYYLIGKMCFPSYVGKTFNGRYALRNNDPSALMIYFICTAICLFLIFLVIDRCLRSQKFKYSPALMALFGTFSFPVLYAIQRGNIIILAIPLTMFFVFFRNSEKKWVRELSYISLAIAAGVKIYPAVFGILLITDKKYKEAARLVLYGIIAFVVPVFAFGGPELLLQLFRNIFSFSSGKASSVSLFRDGYSFQGLMARYFSSRPLTSILAKIIFACLEILAFLMVFVLPRDWQKLTCLCYAVFNIRALSGNYALIFFLLPFIMFITERKKFRWNDILFLVFLALMLIPLPCLWYGLLENNLQSGAVLAGVPEALVEKYSAYYLAHFAGVNKFVSIFAFHGTFLLLLYDAWMTPADKSEIKWIKKLREKAAAKRAAKTATNDPVAEEVKEAETIEST